MTVWVYLFYGQGGHSFSAGLEDELAQLLRQIPGVRVPPTRPYEDWPLSVVKAFLTSPDDKVVLAGHSLGAAMTTHVAERLSHGDRNVDLLVGYDCTLWLRVPIGTNVKRVLEFKGHTWVNPFGMRLLRPPKGSKYETVSTNDYHIDFDSNLNLHRIFVEAVKDLL